MFLSLQTIIFGFKRGLSYSHAIYTVKYAVNRERILWHFVQWHFVRIQKKVPMLSVFGTFFGIRTKCHHRTTLPRTKKPPTPHPPERSITEKCYPGQNPLDPSSLTPKLSSHVTFLTPKQHMKSKDTYLPCCCCPYLERCMA